MVGQVVTVPCFSLSTPNNVTRFTYRNNYQFKYFSLKVIGYSSENNKYQGEICPHLNTSEKRG